MQKPTEQNAPAPVPPSASPQATSSHPPPSSETTFDSIITQNEEMRAALKKASRAAASDVTILLLGESGTGKELVARAIHNASTRKDKAFIAVNCSALTETLLESELFGHERGSFTGAEAKRRGRFEMADSGTLFLDEIGDMAPSAQAKILRAIEYREFERIGGEDSVRVDVRVVAATNRPLPQMIENGEFREDLYFRLNEVRIEIPPLRRRKEDIAVLSEAFIKEFAAAFKRDVKGISHVAMAYLMKHDWPGNVRELRAQIKRAVTVAERDTLWLEDFSINVKVIDTELPLSDSDDLSLATVERRHIERVLELTKGNKRQACVHLKIARPTLDRKLKEYGVKIQR
ncbi:MAG: sigma 54-interacting transcriptional regulator [Planctomycetes bacterium]|nr:sigma 54-interacting transcriptional regulator [Planctomycetota bacterium]